MQIVNGFCSPKVIPGRLLSELPANGVAEHLTVRFHAEEQRINL